MPVGLNKKQRLAILQQQKAKSSQFIKEMRELQEKNKKDLEEHGKQTEKIFNYIENKDIDSKYKRLLRKSYIEREITTEKDVDKYIKNNMKSNKSNTIKNIKDTIKNIKTTVKNENYL